MFEFYFDGETTPRIRVKFREIFTGTQSPFEAPLVGFGAGGFYCYVPLPFEKSCKIVARAERVQFYQINYARYPDDVPISSWKPAAGSEDVQPCAAGVRRCLDLRERISASRRLRRMPNCAVQSQQVSLAPGTTATVFESQSGGRIVGLRIAPASRAGGKGTRPDRCGSRGTGTRSRPCSVRPATSSATPGGNRPRDRCWWAPPDNVSYCYFPMPFDKSAKIELVSERADGPPVELRAEVVTAAVPRHADEGRFYARVAA